MTGPNSSYSDWGTWYNQSNNIVLPPVPTPPTPPPVQTPQFHWGLGDGISAIDISELVSHGTQTLTVNYDSNYQGQVMPDQDYEEPDFDEYEVPLKKMPPRRSNQKIYNIPLLEAFSGRYNFVPKQPGEVGLEIECEGTNLFNSPIQYWATHQDNSLRAHGDHPPIEYVLSKPVARLDVPKALSYLSKKLKEAGSTIDDSTRTSVHVHVNMQDKTIKEIYQYILLYMIFEEVLVDFSGPGRPGNLFCLRAKDAEYNVQVMEQAIKNENFNEMFSNEIRYTACNTASLGKFGSLEFRSMRGTVDQELIQLWVDILLTLKDKALRYGNPREIVEDFLQVGPDVFCRKMFGHDSRMYRVFYGRSDLQKSLWDGLRLMRDVAYAVKWEKYNPELDKKESITKKSSGSRRSYDYSGTYYTTPYVRPRHEQPGLRQGWYWLVNVSPNQVLIPRMDGVSGNWSCQQGTKLLMRNTHRYYQEVNATQEELQPE